MFDQLIGLLLMGLGLQNPVNGMVAGESTDSGKSVVDKRVGHGSENGSTDFKKSKTEARDARSLFHTFEDTIKKQLKASLSGSPSGERDQLRAEAKKAIEAKREELKATLAKLKDTRKATTVGHVVDELVKMNANRTNALSKQLDQIGELLGKVSERAASAKSDGLDTSTVDRAIASAQSAISTAKDAVAAQAGKSYVPTVTSETQVGQQVRTTIQAMKTDIKAVSEKVMAAKGAVRDAIGALEQLVHDDIVPTAPTP